MKSKEIAKIVHEAYGLLYYDGANANAILGHVRPEIWDFDAIHYNSQNILHTSRWWRSGSGYVGCKDFLKEFLPVPIVIKDGELYKFSYDVPKTIGKVKDFYGHFSVLVRSLRLCFALGSDGLKKSK